MILCFLIAESKLKKEHFMTQENCMKIKYQCPEYSHVIHLKFVYVCFLATIAELSSYETEKVTAHKTRNIFYLAFVEMLANP